MTVVTLLLAFFATLFAQDVIGYISNVIGSIIPGVSIAMVMGALWKRATWQGGLASVGVGTLFGVLYLFVAPFQEWIVGIFTGPAIPATIVALVAEVVVSLCTKKEEMSEEARMALVIESRVQLSKNVKCYGRAKMSFISENFKMLCEIGECIAKQFGKDCEVVLHDLTRSYDNTIVAIWNGHVTGREVGGGRTECRPVYFAGNCPTEGSIQLYQQNKGEAYFALLQ